MKLYFPSYVIILFLIGCIENQTTAHSENDSPVISNIISDVDSALIENSITLYCAASDPKGNPLSYSWSADYGIIYDNDSVATWIAPAEQGTYEIICIVTNNKDLSNSASVTVKVYGVKHLIYQNDFSTNLEGWSVSSSISENGNISSIVLNDAKLVLKTRSNTSAQTALAVYDYENNIQDLINLEKILVTIEFDHAHFLSSSMNNYSSYLSIDFGNSRLEMNAQPYFGFYLNLMNVVYSFHDKKLLITDKSNMGEKEIDSRSYKLVNVSGFNIRLGSKSWIGTDICPTCGGSNTTIVDEIKIESINSK